MPPMPTVVSVSSAAMPMPLLPSEQIIFRVRPHLILPFSLIILIWLVGGLLLWFLIKQNALVVLPFISPITFILIFIFALAFAGLAIFLSWFNTEYILTTKRVEWRFGIFGEKTISILLLNIENLVLLRSIIGRIFNYGDIKIEPAGLTTRINFGGIPNPVVKKEQIEAATG